MDPGIGWQIVRDDQAFGLECSGGELEISDAVFDISDNSCLISGYSSRIRLERVNITGLGVGGYGIVVSDMNVSVRNNLVSDVETGLYNINCSSEIVNNTFLRVKHGIIVEGRADLVLDVRIEYPWLDIIVEE